MSNRVEDWRQLELEREVRPEAPPSSNSQFLRLVPLPTFSMFEAAISAAGDPDRWVQGQQLQKFWKNSVKKLNRIQLTPRTD